MRTILFVIYLLFTYSAIAQVLPLNNDDGQLQPKLSWESTRIWNEIHDLDGRFAILAPGEFKTSVDTIATDVGELIYHTFFLQSPGERADNLVYMLSYVDYPEGSLHHDSTDLVTEFFQASMEEAINTVDGELLFVNEETLQDYPGRFWRIDYLDGKASIRTKTFIVGRRYYQVQTVSSTDRGLNDSSGKYLGSLRFF
ncbi:MAG: hypothetical protein AAF741_06475 [Bacteroidota bacterium]